MKKLILLILLPVFGQLSTFGQEIVIDTLLPQHENWYEEDLHLLSLLKQYTDECYADSTQECGWVFIPNADINIETPQEFLYQYGWNDWQCWWEHKEPTISDLVKWLSERLGE